jgi:hypothetical protein
MRGQIKALENKILYRLRAGEISERQYNILSDHLSWAWLLAETGNLDESQKTITRVKDLLSEIEATETAERGVR